MDDLDRLRALRRRWDAEGKASRTTSNATYLLVRFLLESGVKWDDVSAPVASLWLNTLAPPSGHGGAPPSWQPGLTWPPTSPL